MIPNIRLAPWGSTCRLCTSQEISQRVTYHTIGIRVGPMTKEIPLIFRKCFLHALRERLPRYKLSQAHSLIIPDKSLNSDVILNRNQSLKSVLLEPKNTHLHKVICVTEEKIE